MNVPMSETISETASTFESLQVLVHEPDVEADSCIIWLHGLGATAYDFAPITPFIRQYSGQPGLRMIYPQAPSLSVSINGGMMMPAWYDILSASPRRTINTHQYQQAIHAIQDLVKQQINNGLESKRVFIAGFSQGGAVAYQAACGFTESLAGVISLSTYIADTLKVAPENQQLPVFIGHGSQDMVVPEMLGLEALEWFRANRFEPVWKKYPLQHEVNEDELKDVADFIGQTLSAH